MSQQHVEPAEGARLNLRRSRRNFIFAAIGVGATGALLVACGGSASPSPTAASQAAAPAQPTTAPKAAAPTTAPTTAPTPAQAAAAAQPTAVQPAATAPASGKLSGTLDVQLTQFRADDGVDPKSGKKILGFATMAQPFLKANPDLKVQFTQIAANSPNAALAKYQTLLLSGQSDILEGATFWPYYKQGLVEDLSPYFRRDNWASHFIKSIYSNPSERFLYPPWTSDATTIIAAPVGLDEFSVAYDKQIFDDWGVEPLSDKPTIDEIMQKAPKLTGKDPKTGQKTYGIFYDPRAQAHIMLFYFGHGVDFGQVDPQDPAKLTLDTPQVKSGIEQMIAASKYCPPGFEIGQGIENWGTKDNTVAIRLVTWATDMLNALNNNLQQRFVVTTGIHDKNGHGMYVASLAYIMAKSSKNKEAAWDLIKFMSGPVGQKFVYDNYAYLPSWLDENWVDPKTNPYAKQYMATAADAVNAFFPEFMFTDFRPWMAGVVSNAINHQSYDLTGGLAEMQKKGEAWAKKQ